MYAFQYEQASSVAQATSLIAAGGQALAGGQTMLAAMKQRLMAPEKLVDLAKIKELVGIEVSSTSVLIKAMTTHQAVELSADVFKQIPALSLLAGGIADRQVRALGTIGGSVANNDPAACYPSALLALGATVITQQREIAADDFFLGMYATALEPGELITGIRFPIPQRAGYAKFKQPASRFALVGVFVAQTKEGVRVAVTGAGNGVFRHDGLERALTHRFTVQAVDGVKIDPAELNSDIHASALYRANLITVQTKEAVRLALTSTQ